jgi:hypothetical protein
MSWWTETRNEVTSQAKGAWTNLNGKQKTILVVLAIAVAAVFYLIGAVRGYFGC